MIQTTNRFLGAALAAASITAALFWVMTALIRVEDTSLPPEDERRVILSVFVEPEERPIEKIRRIPERKPVIEPDPLPPIDSDREGNGIQHAIHRQDPVFVDPGPGITDLTNPDGEAVPLVRVPPSYPARALARGIEGRVLVEFTISRIGTVEDPQIIAYEPSPVFNQAALEAIRSWRYEPKRVNGQAVAQPGQRIVIPFQKGQRTE